MNEYFKTYLMKGLLPLFNLVCAAICAALAGCKLSCSSIDFSIEPFDFSSTNTVCSTFK